MKNVKLIAILIFTFQLAYSQNKQDSYFKSIQENEPNTENSIGKKNSSAPEALKEFEFMLGEFHCTDSVPNQDGTYRVYPSIWKAKYFLNGYAIQDNSFNPVNPTSNLRVYDDRSKTWKVTYLQAAVGYYTGVWEGSMNAENEMVLTADINGNKSILTFYNISRSSYNWKSETIKPDGSSSVGWRKTCKQVN